MVLEDQDFSHHLPAEINLHILFLFCFSTRKSELQGLHTPGPFSPKEEFEKLVAKQIQNKPLTFSSI